jgi:hypothetical protein
VGTGPASTSSRAAETGAILAAGSDSPPYPAPNLATLDPNEFDIAIAFYASGVAAGRNDGWREGYLEGFYDGGERADADAADQFAAMAAHVRGMAGAPSYAELERRRAA